MIGADAAVTIRNQVSGDSADPVILVNVFHAPPGETAAWTGDAHLKPQPGLIPDTGHGEPTVRSGLDEGYVLRMSGGRTAKLRAYFGSLAVMAASKPAGGSEAHA